MSPRSGYRALAPLAAILGLALVPAVAAQRRPARVITTGRSIEDTLRKSDVLLARDSTYAREWQFQAVRGEVVTIDLASERFDAYLVVYGPGLTRDLQDDDSGGNCNARLTVRFPESGAYHIAVTSTYKLQTGPFTLSVASGVKPKLLSRCRRNR